MKTIWMLVCTLICSISYAGPLLIIKKERPIAERPDLIVMSYSHIDKFRGYHTVVIQKIGKQKTVLFKRVHCDQPYLHHEYAMFWTLCRFGDPEGDHYSSSSEDDIEKEFFYCDNCVIGELYPIIEDEFF